MHSIPSLSAQRPESLNKVIVVSLALTAVACVSLWLVRTCYAISFVLPYTLLTTGCEEESIFSIWKFVAHQSVYTDPHRIPFASSYFNWGYYLIYGWVARACIYRFHLGDIWIPTIGRLVTIGCTFMTGATFRLALRFLAPGGMFARPLVAWSWTVIAALSPLVGFWSITVRPDVGALLFESAGLCAILAYLHKRNHAFIILAAILFYAGWAFKQSAVTVLVGSVVALLLLKRWRAFVILSGVWWLIVVVTLVAGGRVYRECILFSQAHLSLVLSVGLENVLKATLRNPLLLLSSAVILVSSLKNPSVLVSKPIELTIVSVALFSLFFYSVLCCKLGANTNYFIPVAWSAMLAVVPAFGRMNSRSILAGMTACSLFMLVGIVHSLIGPSINNDFRYSESAHIALAERLARLPGPAFVTERYADLPWVQRDSPHFVLAYAYDTDREAGVSFEDGGWEGLAQDGYFGTIVEASYVGPGFSLLFDARSDIEPSLLLKYKMVDEYRDNYIDYKFYERAGSGVTSAKTSSPPLRLEPGAPGSFIARLERLRVSALSRPLSIRIDGEH
jgi:hypothetical protein